MYYYQFYLYSLYSRLVGSHVFSVLLEYIYIVNLDTCGGQEIAQETMLILFCDMLFYSHFDQING